MVVQWNGTAEVKFTWIVLTVAVRRWLTRLAIQASAAALLVSTLVVLTIKVKLISSGSRSTSL